MHSSLWQQIKQHPQAMLFSIVLHLILIVILVFSLEHTDKPSLPNKPAVKTVQAVVVDATQIDQELNKLKRIDQDKKRKEASRKKAAQRELEKTKQQRRKEEKRLAEIKKQQKLKAKQEKARQAKLKKEREKKQQELAKLEQQQKDLEKKRRAEQQKLAAIEAKRKAEETAAREKREAQEAERRRQAEEAELRHKLAEEEQRQAQQNSRLQTLRGQYVKLIQRQVARNWLPPATMTNGWNCEVMVQQNRLGDVTQVQMLKCSGSDAFKSTVERAVRKSSPLPPPPSPDVFDSRLQFTFRPDL